MFLVYFPFSRIFIRRNSAVCYSRSGKGVKQMKITVRLDDITPDMDWNRFYRVKAIFDKYKVKPLIGVVPDNQDDGLKCGEFHEDFWEYVVSLEKSGWTIAQHGYRHIYETKNSGLLGIKKASEFAGLPYEVQYEKLRCGREILQKHGWASPLVIGASAST